VKLPSLLAGACLLLPGLALAQADISQVWINPGFYSLHFDRNKGLEDANPGALIHVTPAAVPSSR